MAIKGSLTEASLSDVIQLLAYSGKSGCLSVTDARNFGNVFIKDGKIIYATIINREQRLGDILVIKKLIDEETMTRALEIQKSEKKKRRFGEILVDMGAITKEILEKELKAQIEQVIFTLLTWETGYFNFETDLLPLAREYTVQLSAQDILLEGARRIDEWKKIEGKMPPFETVLFRKTDVDTEDISLTTEEKKILESVDGSRSIDDILRISEFDFFETCKIIYGLISAGLFKKPEKPLEDKKVTGDISEHKNLGFAFYKTEMYDEAEREFNKMLDIESNNTEALFYLGLIELRRGNYEASRKNLLKASESEKTRSIFTNLGHVCIKLKLYDEAIDYLNQAGYLATDNLKVKCNLGIAFYCKGNLDMSSQIFKEIIAQSPEIITPYIYLPLIYLQQEKSEESTHLLRDAIDRFPRFTVFKNNLAVVYESIGKPEEAEKLFRQALETNPRDEKICRNLADFYYETQILGAAKELYEKIPDDKRDWKILFKLGNIYLRQGDSNKALNSWEKARELNPSEEIITRNIEVLQKSGDK